MISRILTTGLFVAALSFSTSAFAADAVKVQEGASGKMLASMCSGCHGVGGKSAGDAPDLAGLEAKEVFEALKDFKGAPQDKKNTIMARIAKGYSEADMHAVAKEIATWK